MRHAITTVPVSVAQALSNVLTGVVAIPLRDADPSTIMLVGHDDRRNPNVMALRAFARDIAGMAAELGGTPRRVDRREGSRLAAPSPANRPRFRRTRGS
jgi:hypothetical protein